MTENLYHNIILNQDVERLCTLSSSEKEDFLFILLYNYLYTKSLNELKKTLVLASTLEDTCQADALPSLSEDREIFLALPEMKKALEKLGALKTAAFLDEFISLVPVGIVPEWEWFFADERGDIIDKIDYEICGYPDGRMYDLYIAYISNPQNAEQLLLNLDTTGFILE